MINACWSGFVPHGTDVGSYADYSEASGFPQADHPAIDPATGTPNIFVQCTIDGIDPNTDADSLGCRLRMTTAADDPASNLAMELVNNQVTVYACFDWSPPLAGLLFVPTEVTMKAVVTESIQRQQ